jgi:hypothetical protein
MTKASQEDKRPLSERQMEGDDQKAWAEHSKRMTECAMKANGMK